MNELKILIPINPVTKKNHGNIVMIKGHPIMLPSKPYQEYEKKCKAYMPRMAKPIDVPINLECHYYLETRRKCDLTNLLQATCDILVKYKVLEDDNYTIVASVDGTKAEYDKENPRTEIIITKKEG
jgi:Holliday junction resolvase RusA-like endonuclease